MLEETNGTQENKKGTTQVLCFCK